jgi:N-acetylglucosamine-1-phosphate uridyltransferase (contains nucleotidyltransferase and I-patch acetyltransferase domains)
MAWISAPFSYIEGARIETGAVIGPFARLRPGSVIGSGARVGNFVETKNATLAAGAKANHLTYLGDVKVGAGANVGAGTITCNYDGFGKYETVIGAGAFIGSNRRWWRRSRWASVRRCRRQRDHPGCGAGRPGGGQGAGKWRSRAGQACSGRRCRS